MNRLIKAKRVILGVKQEDIASMLKINPTTYSLKENGKQDFKQTEIKKLIDFFKITPEETMKIFLINLSS